MTTLPQFLGLGGRTVTLAENFRIGIDALLAQKLRSFLTTLGIIFGVAAVISMTSISAGAQSEILDAIQSLGVNNIIVSILEPEDTDLLLENRRTNPNWLTLEDAQAIRDLLTDAGAVVPIRRVEEKVHFPVEGGSGIVGTSPEFQTVFHIRLIAGRFISDDDVNSRAPVGVITETLRRELFPLSNPLGQQVKVKKSWFTIIGVIEPPLGGFTSAGLDLPDMSDDVYIPLSTLNARFAVKKTESPLEAVVINIPNENKVRSVANAAERIISRRHRKAEDFQI
ncbi:MAG TPA: hypothetical protein ENH10_03195, partial [Bacteroidetes bacterium]|nr:hypothetical protein [Bacteroidota bacterium]HEX04148.1 hypothetical protein [Bacteroidota bacterium]